MTGTGAARKPRQIAPTAQDARRGPAVPRGCGEERDGESGRRGDGVKSGDLISPRHPKLHTHREPSEKQIRQKRKQYKKLSRKLFGRIAIEASDKVEEVGGWIGGLACSLVWAEDALLHDVEYPPGGGERKRGGEGETGGRGESLMRTRMQLCMGCGAMVPPQYLGSSGHCADCRLEEMPDEQSSRLQSSASVVDYFQIRGRR